MISWAGAAPMIVSVKALDRQVNEKEKFEQEKAYVVVFADSILIHVS